MNAFVQLAMQHLTKSPVLSNLKSGIYGLEEIRAVSALFLLSALVYVSLRGRKLSLVGLLCYYWFLVSGLCNVFIEGYAAYWTRLFAAHRCEFLEALWRLYTAHLGGNGSIDQWAVGMLVSALLIGPSSLLVACCLRKGLKFAFAVQIFVSSLRLSHHLSMLLGSADLLENCSGLFIGYHSAMLLLSVTSIFYSMWKVTSN